MPSAKRLKPGTKQNASGGCSMRRWKPCRMSFQIRTDGFIDILGFAAARTVHASDVEAAMQDPYAGIITALGEHGPQTIEDIADARNITAIIIRDHLGELTRMGMTTKMKYGQEIRHALTPEGVLVAEELSNGNRAEDLLAGVLR